jgi:hypothetical protein
MPFMPRQLSVRCGAFSREFANVPNGDFPAAEFRLCDAKIMNLLAVHAHILLAIAALQVPHCLHARLFGVHAKTRELAKSAYAPSVCARMQHTLIGAACELAVEKEANAAANRPQAAALPWQRVRRHLRADLFVCNLQLAVCVW